MLENRLFVGGMNMDDEVRFIPRGDYGPALNCRNGISSNDSYGVIENLNSNRQITVSLPGGLNTVIGSKDDIRNQRVFYFIWNSNGNHTIAEYKYSTGVITKLMTASMLGFDTDYLITGIDVVDNIYLYWTDGLNEPSFLDIEKARNSQYPSPLVRQYFDAIPYAPGFSPVCVYGSDTAYKYNNLRGSLWQFKYKYVYDDYRESSWSPISKCPLPDEYSFVLKLDPNISQNNFISVSLDTGEKTVRKIKVAARKGNVGDFYFVKTIESSEITPLSQYTFSFYNDGAYSIVELNDSIKLFDFLPKVAKSQSLIDGNRIAYGNITDGFDPVTVDYNIHQKYNGSESQSSEYDFQVNGTAALNQSTLQPDPNLGFMVVDLTVLTTPKVNDVILVSFQWGNEPLNYTYSYTTQETTIVALLNNMASSINSFANDNKLPLVTAGNPTPVQTPPFVASVLDDNTLRISSLFLSFSMKKIQNFTFSGVSIIGSEYQLRSFKSGCNHELGIVYYDNPNRSGTVNLDSDSTFYVPFFNESDIRGSYKIATTDVSMTIRSKPPVWATHYQIVYTKGLNYSSFVQYVVGKVELRGDNIYISLAPLFIYDKFQKNSIIRYSYKKGDRVRFITTNGGSFWSYLRETEITSWDPDKLEITVNNADSTPSVGDITNGALVEIYSPRAELQDKIYYEIGECLPVIDSGLATRRHQSQTDFTFPGRRSGALPIDITQTGSNKLTFVHSSDTPYFKVGDQFTIAADVYSGNATVIGVQSKFYDGDGTEYYYVLDVDYISDSFVFVSFNQTFNGENCICPALISLIGQGDVYYKTRIMAFTSSTTAELLPTDIQYSLKTFNVEDVNFSDFYESAVTNIGRPNIYSPDSRETNRYATIFYSQPYIPNTNINGLGTFFDLNFEDYNKSYGSIQHLYAEDRNLIVFQEDKVGRLLINQAVFSDVSGQAVIGQTTKVLSDIIYYAGEFGISTNPESFAVYGFRKYFTDSKRGSVLRLSQDGITVISDLKMRNYFNTELFDGTPMKVFGCYNRRFDEYVLAAKKESSVKYPVTGMYSWVPLSQGLFEQRNPDGTTQEFTTAEMLDTWAITPGSPRSTGLVINANLTEYFNLEEVDTNLYFMPANGFIEYTYNTEDSVGNIGIIRVLNNPNDIVIKYFPETGQSVIVSKQISSALIGESYGLQILLPSVENVSLGFSEKLKRWTSFYNYIPENLSSSGLDMVSFKDGRLYQHEVSDLYGYLYDGAVSGVAKIEVISNEQPANIKFYHGLQVQSNEVWEMPVGKNDQNQLTNLIASDFEVREGNFSYAAFLKDTNTPNVEFPLIEGDMMRSYSMSILLQNGSNSLVELFSVGIKYGLSELSNR